MPGLPVRVSGRLDVILEGASGLVEWWPGEVSKALECAGFSLHPVLFFFFFFSFFPERNGAGGEGPSGVISRAEG